jgi:hypothetical protein
MAWPNATVSDSMPAEDRRERTAIDAEKLHPTEGCPVEGALLGESDRHGGKRDEGSFLLWPRR